MSHLALKPKLCRFWFALTTSYKKTTTNNWVGSHYRLWRDQFQAKSPSDQSDDQHLSQPKTVLQFCRSAENAGCSNVVVPPPSPSSSEVRRKYSFFPHPLFAWFPLILINCLLSSGFHYFSHFAHCLCNVQSALQTDIIHMYKSIKLTILWNPSTLFGSVILDFMQDFDLFWKSLFSDKGLRWGENYQRRHDVVTKDLRLK